MCSVVYMLPGSGAVCSGVMGSVSSVMCCFVLRWGVYDGNGIVCTCDTIPG